MFVITLNAVFGFLIFINIFLGMYVLFAQRRNPAVTWAWLMVVAFLPVAGFIIYMVMGQDLRKHRAFLKKAEDDAVILDGFINKYKFKKALDAEAPGGLIGLNKSTGSILTDDNHVSLFHEGQSKFDSLLKDIEAAKHFILIQYYILRDDEIGRHIIRQLAKKAMDGVSVFLLVDGMGCIFTPRSAFKPLLDAGGRLGVFMPPVPVRLNFRNHRKLVVVDGAVGYLGGFNIGNEYLGITKRFGFWRDTHMRVAGGAVSYLTLRFIMDWNFACKDKLPLETRFFPQEISAAPAAAGENIFKNVRIQVVSCGPDTRNHNVLNGFIKMISGAKRSVYIQSPYFVPDEGLFSALRVAALSGVDVRIMIPANPDHLFVYWAALSYLGDLIDVGVRCFEYEKGFIHAKTVMIDGQICTLGTANMDERSFKLNFECTAFIYDQNVTSALEAAFTSDTKDCRELTPEQYAVRPRSTRIKESLSRLLAPLL